MLLETVTIADVLAVVISWTGVVAGYVKLGGRVTEGENRTRALSSLLAEHRTDFSKGMSDLKHELERMILAQEKRFDEFRVNQEKKSDESLQKLNSIETALAELKGGLNVRFQLLDERRPRTRITD